MADHPDIVAKLARALDAASHCQASETTENYDALGEELEDLGELAQRSSQADADCRALIGKLRAGAALTADEMARVRLLIVGDADYYLKYDEEYARSKAEIAKIIGEIQRLQAGALSGETLMHLSVLCREACNLLGAAQHYLDSRDRVRHFEAATQGPLDAAAGRTLAGVVDDMLRQ